MTCELHRGTNETLISRFHSISFQICTQVIFRLAVVEGALFFFLTCIPLSQDDIIDDVDSFVAAAETLKERGAYKIFVMATHGLLSCEAPRFIEESAIDEVGPPLPLLSGAPSLTPSPPYVPPPPQVVVTNTIPHELQKLQCPKIKTVDISMILSEAIRRIHNGESMSYLFRNIGVDD